jgi:hypothetical protein
MAEKKKSGMTDAQKVSIGVGLTAAVAAAAGTFFLYGSKSAAKNRKVVKSWALKAKAEVLEKLEDAKEMSRDEYEQLVSSVAKAYTIAKSASKKDLVEFTKEMKDHWRSIEKAAAPAKKAAKKAVKTAVKKADTAVATAETVAKKAVKKAAK